MPLQRAAMLLALSALSGCVPVGPSLQPDEIAHTDVSLPDGAEPGMFVRWRIRGSDVVGDVVERELACVPGGPPAPGRSNRARRTRTGAAR